jgi:hypothetical protein
LATIGDQHYRTHEEVKGAINPEKPLNIAKIPMDIYLSYTKLENLSRRARYLCSDDLANRGIDAFFTVDKHFAKAIRHMDKVLSYFATEHKVAFPPITLSCIQFSTKELGDFKIIKAKISAATAGAA